MKHPLIIASTILSLTGIGAAAVAVVSPVAAQSAIAHATQTTTFAIQNMTCALCPVTVKKSLEKKRGK